ncbi:MAG: hypothetical protein ACK5HJ_03120, partial [Bacteroidota bacterium]
HAGISYSIYQEQIAITAAKFMCSNQSGVILSVSAIQLPVQRPWCNFINAVAGPGYSEHKILDLKLSLHLS